MSELSVTRPRGDLKALLLILAIGVQLAVIGAYVGFKTLSGDDAPVAAVAAKAPAPVTGFGVGDDVKTSFGSIVVGTAQNIGGVGSDDLRGMNHGIGAYIGPNEAGVHVTVVVTNRTKKPISYSPEQFALRSDTGAVTPLERASIKPNTLLPDAAIEATLIFVVPREGQKLSLTFRDPALSAPLLVDIGHVDTAPGDATSGAHE